MVGILDKGETFGEIVDCSPQKVDLIDNTNNTQGSDQICAKRLKV